MKTFKDAIDRICEYYVPGSFEGDEFTSIVSMEELLHQFTVIGFAECDGAEVLSYMESKGFTAYPVDFAFHLRLKTSPVANDFTISKGKKMNEMLEKAEDVHRKMMDLFKLHKVNYLDLSSLPEEALIEWKLLKKLHADLGVMMTQLMNGKRGEASL